MGFAKCEYVISPIIEVFRTTWYRMKLEPANFYQNVQLLLWNSMGSKTWSVEWIDSKLIIIYIIPRKNSWNILDSNLSNLTFDKTWTRIRHTHGLHKSSSWKRLSRFYKNGEPLAYYLLTFPEHDWNKYIQTFPILQKHDEILSSLPLTKTWRHEYDLDLTLSKINPN